MDHRWPARRRRERPGREDLRQHGDHPSLAGRSRIVKERRRTLMRRSFTAASSDAFVFTGRNGRPLTRRNALRAWQVATKDVLGNPLRLHDLRTTFASRLAANRVDVATAQALLRHARPSTTLEVYTRVQGDAVARLERMRERARCVSRCQTVAISIGSAYASTRKWPGYRGGGRDSNPRPPGPQPGALPTELPPPRPRQDSSAGLPVQLAAVPPVLSARWYEVGGRFIRPQARTRFRCAAPEGGVTRGNHRFTRVKPGALPTELPPPAPATGCRALRGTIACY